MASFKIGDLVRLKSGSPTVTVKEIAGGSITCIWFHGEEAKYQAFKADTQQAHSPASVGSVRVS